jgi:hypothetical protein
VVTQWLFSHHGAWNGKTFDYPAVFIVSDGVWYPSGSLDYTGFFDHFGGRGSGGEQSYAADKSIRTPFTAECEIDR